MRTVVLCQVPYSNASSSIAAYDLSLIWMDNHVIHGRGMAVASLDGTTSCFPDLDGAILGARHHPLALAVEGNACNIVCMSFECQKGIRIGRLDIVELNAMVSSCCQKAFIRRYAESVYLRVWMLDCSRADAGESLPEPGKGPSANCITWRSFQKISQSTYRIVWS
jgi:hypothetical protein